MANDASSEAANLYGQEFTARASLARIDRYAIHIAAIICQDFNLSVSGQRHLSKALSDLPCVSTDDERLNFGWSEDHQLRSRRVAEQGFERLAILTSLAETFHKEYAAEVMHRFATAVLKDPAVLPHKSQWRDLIRACNGVLAGDEFGLLVEKYIRLDPFSTVPGAHPNSARSMTPAKSVAEAILAMSKVANGQRKNLTLAGGAVIGWIAALAEHFFGMDIAVFSNSDEHLHGLQNVHEADLTLIYHDKYDLHIMDKGPEVTKPSINGLTIDDLAYSNHMHFLPFGGRSTWAALLPQVFGRSFHRLDRENSKLMFVAIGSAFRAMEERTFAKAGDPKKVQNLPIVPLQWLRTLTAFLPTLQQGLGKMERQFKLSPHHADETYTYSMQELRKACQCGVCSKNKPQETSYCMPCIVATIVDLGLILSRVVITQQINPSREGLQHLYKARTKLEHSLGASTDADNASVPVGVFHGKLLQARTPVILQGAVELFSGGQIEEQLPAGLVALSHEGICAFSAELENETTSPGMQGMVRAITGAISLQQKVYRRACLGERPSGRDAWEWEEVKIEHLQQPLWCK